MFAVSDPSASSGDCPLQLCLGGEQDAVESLKDSLDMLGRYLHSINRLRHSLQGCWPSHYDLVTLVTKDSAV